jgi:antitoxin (DNA-binding transcriptional repressor) of toxin-antitoxin stability system
MKSIEAHDLPAALDGLLAWIQRGEHFLVMRQGKPVAELGPVAEPDTEALQAAILRIDALREALAHGGMTIGDALGNLERIRGALHERHKAE